MLVSFASSWLPSSKLLVNAWALSTRAYERQGWGLRAFVQNLEDRRRGTRLAQLLDRVWHQWWESHLPFWVNPKHGHTAVGNSWREEWKSYPGRIWDAPEWSPQTCWEDWLGWARVPGSATHYRICRLSESCSDSISFAFAFWWGPLKHLLVTWPWFLVFL